MTAAAKKRTPARRPAKQIVDDPISLERARALIHRALYIAGAAAVDANLHDPERPPSLPIAAELRDVARSWPAGEHRWERLTALLAVAATDKTTMGIDCLGFTYSMGSNARMRTARERREFSPDALQSEAAIHWDDLSSVIREMKIRRTEEEWQDFSLRCQRVLHALMKGTD